MLTAKREAFCQNVAKGLNQTEAYIAAFLPKTIDRSVITSTASELAAVPEVAERISVLAEGGRAISVKAQAHTLDVALSEAEEALRLAIASGKSKDVLGAAMLKARLAGHISDNKGKTPADGLDALDVAVVKRMVDQLVGQQPQAIVIKQESIALPSDTDDMM